MCTHLCLHVTVLACLCGVPYVILSLHPLGEVGGSGELVSVYSDCCVCISMLVCTPVSQSLHFCVIPNNVWLRNMSFLYWEGIISLRDYLLHTVGALCTHCVSCCRGGVLANHRRICENHYYHMHIIFKRAVKIESVFNMCVTIMPFLCLLESFTFTVFHSFKQIRHLQFKSFAFLHSTSTSTSTSLAVQCHDII